MEEVCFLGGGEGSGGWENISKVQQSLHQTDHTSTTIAKTAVLKTRQQAEHHPKQVPSHLIGQACPWCHRVKFVTHDWRHLTEIMKISQLEYWRFNSEG